MHIISGANKHFSYQKHFHDNFAIGLITAGRMRISYRGEKYVGCKGDIIAIPQGELHDGQSDTDLGCEYEIVYPDSKTFRRTTNLKRFGRLKLDFAQPFITDSQVQTTLRRGLEALKRQAYEDSGLCDEAIQRAFQELIDRHATYTMCADKQSETAVRIKTHIDERFDEISSITEIGKIHGISEPSVIKLFKKQHGMTPHQYLMKRRVDGAVGSILAGVGLAKAAYDNGFSDQSHMCRVFRKFIGVRPSGSITTPMSGNEIREGEEAR